MTQDHASHIPFPFKLMFIIFLGAYLESYLIQLSEKEATNSLVDNIFSLKGKRAT